MGRSERLFGRRNVITDDGEEGKAEFVKVVRVVKVVEVKMENEN